MRTPIGIEVAPQMTSGSFYKDTLGNTQGARLKRKTRTCIHTSNVWRLQRNYVPLTGFTGPQFWGFTLGRNLGESTEPPSGRPVRSRPGSWASPAPGGGPSPAGSVRRLPRLSPAPPQPVPGGETVSGPPPAAGKATAERGSSKGRGRTGLHLQVSRCPFLRERCRRGEKSVGLPPSEGAARRAGLPERSCCSS